MAGDKGPGAPDRGLKPELAAMASDSTFLFPMRPSVPRMLPSVPDDYLVQAKYDGWNIVVNGGRVWTRRGKDITPWRQDWGFDLDPRHPVNGELLAEADGEVAARAAIQGIRTGRCRPRVVAFDVILDGPALEERLDIVRHLASGAMQPAPTTDLRGASWDDVNLMLEEAKAQGHEGLVLKRKGSRYVTSREVCIVTEDWLKVKVPVRRVRARGCDAGGVTPQCLRPRA